MSRHNSTLLIPKSMNQRYAEITALTDDYCSKTLDKEYAQLSRLTTTALCRKKLSPIQIGSVLTWACGIIYAVGFVNFLFDKNTSPYVNAADLASAFGISKSTAGNKSKQIRDLLKMKQFDHHWYLPSRIESSPMAWNIMYNGFIVDARMLSRDIQAIAYEKGLTTKHGERSEASGLEARDRRASKGVACFWPVDASRRNAIVAFPSCRANRGKRKICRVNEWRLGVKDGLNA